MSHTRLINNYIQAKKRDKSRTDYSCSIAFYLYLFIAFIGLFSFVMVYEFFTRVTLDWTLTTIKYFTTLSGYFMTIVALIMAIAFGLLKHNKIRSIPKGLSILNLVATSSICLTMAITVLILTPGSIFLADSGMPSTKSLYEWSNLFFHVLVPVLSIVAFICYAKTCEIKLVECLYSLIPGLIYMTIYVALAYTHRNPDGSFQEGYDWYYFCSFGVWPAIGIALAIVGVLFGSSVLLRYGNKKSNKNEYFIRIFMQAFILLLIIVGAVWKKQGQQWWEVFKYFESLVSFVLFATIIIYLVYLAKLKDGKIKAIPLWLCNFRLVLIASLLLVFIFGIFVYLPIFIAKGMYDQCALLTDSGLYFRALIPMFATFTYLAFEHNELKFKWTLFSLIPPMVYSIIYIVNIYVNKDSGLDIQKWDWYRIYQYFDKNIKLIWLIPLIAAPWSALCGYILWIANRKMDIKLIKIEMISKKKRLAK